jgi:hypothetical protein
MQRKVWLHPRWTVLRGMDELIIATGDAPPSPRRCILRDLALTSTITDFDPRDIRTMIRRADAEPPSRQSYVFALTVWRNGRWTRSAKLLRVSVSVSPRQHSGRVATCFRSEIRPKVPPSSKATRSGSKPSRSATTSSDLRLYSFTYEVKRNPPSKWHHNKPQIPPANEHGTLGLVRAR